MVDDRDIGGASEGETSAWPSNCVHASTLRLSRSFALPDFALPDFTGMVLWFRALLGLAS